VTLEVYRLDDSEKCKAGKLCIFHWSWPAMLALPEGAKAINIPDDEQRLGIRDRRWRCRRYGFGC
jgi:hypothetical protein